MPSRIRENIKLAEYHCELCENFFWIEDNGVVPERMDCPYCKGQAWLNEDKIEICLTATKKENEGT